MGELQLVDVTRLDEEGGYAADDERPLPLTRQRDFGTSILLLLVALLLSFAVLAFTNPFPTLVRYTSAIAQPTEPLSSYAFAASVSEWCLRTDPYGQRRQSGRFRDDGTGGDVTAGDGILTTEFTFAGAGLHYWEAVACDDSRVTLPEEPAWLVTGTADRSVRLSFDINNYSGPQQTMWPARYALSAADDSDAPRVVGSFQGWQRQDPAGALKRVDGDFFRAVYPIAQPGQHTGIVVNIFEDEWQAYSANGRSAKWNGFAFETRRPGEAIVVELDKAASRSAIYFDVPAPLLWLAYEGGFYILAAVLAGLALALALLTIKRYQILRLPQLQVSAGCPQCGERRLVRVPRRRRDRLLTLFGLRNGRFICRERHWQGVRLIGQAVPLAAEPPRLLVPAIIVLLLVLAAIAAALLLGDLWVPGSPGELLIARLAQLSL